MPAKRSGRRALRIFKLLIFLVVAAFCGLLLYGYGRNHPEDLPWTDLDLAQPVGAFTGRKLADLAGEGERCKRLLTRAGIAYRALPPHWSGDQCGYSDAVRFRGGGAIEIHYRPADLGMSCPVAAAMVLWEWHVVQPAALKHFGQKVATIDHLGSYSCRRLYGRSEGSWSEHATANAIDIAGFRLEKGRRINILRDWDGDEDEARFLREVRDGGCRLFATVLSPDYNRAHRDHLHLDQAARGSFGWRACR